MDVRKKVITMKTTIKDIAQIAGVSVATVSRVINNKSKGVSEKTRKRIWGIIEENNFQPSAVARGLVTKRSKIIGLMIPDITNPFYSKLAKGVEDAASLRNYNIILCDGGNIPEKEAAHLSFLNEHYVSGIIYNNVQDISPLTLEILNRHEQPTIFIDSKIELSGAINLYIDNKKAMMEVVHYLYQQGHRRIAFIGGATDSYSTKRRFDGYVEALKELSIQVDMDLIVDGGYSIDSAMAAANALLEKNTDFTAVACCNDLLAIGVYETFEARGVHIPKDISVVGFDDIHIARLLRPKLTTIRQPNYEMGKTAANLMIDILEEKEEEIGRNIIFETELIIRHSVERRIQFDRS